jgi:hypothetical protein
MLRLRASDQLPQWLQLAVPLSCHCAAHIMSFLSMFTKKECLSAEHDTADTPSQGHNSFRSMHLLSGEQKQQRLMQPQPRN